MIFAQINCCNRIRHKRSLVFVSRPRLSTFKTPKNVIKTICTCIYIAVLFPELNGRRFTMWFSYFIFLVSDPGGGVLSYMGYIGMCGPKGYGFSSVLVINRVSILADFGHKLGMVFVL